LTQEKIEFKLFKERCDEAGLDQLIILFDNHIEFQEVFNAVNSTESYEKQLRYIQKSIKKIDPYFFKPLK
jgi:hypothetical protein